MSFFADKVVSEGLNFNYAILIPSYSVVSLSDFESSSCFNQNMRTNSHGVIAAVNSVVNSIGAIDKDKRNI